MQEWQNWIFIFKKKDKSRIIKDDKLEQQTQIDREENQDRNR